MRLIRRLIVIAILFALPSISKAQLDATSETNADVLVQNIMGNGAILVPGTAVLTCPNGAAGTFSDPSSSVGLANGVMLTTGNVDLYESGVNEPAAGQDNGVDQSDPALTQMEPQAHYDPCYIEFDIIPICDTLKIDYVFASEEYPDYVCSNYNDAFGFFISGPGIAGPFPNGAENIATIPNTNTYVTINTVNGGTAGIFGTPGGCPNGGLNNTQYYVDNANGMDSEFNGYTVPLTAMSPVTPCETYHMKLIIADAGDGIYDSGVFLAQAGLSCPANTVEWTVAVDSTVEGCSDAVFTLSRDGDLTASLDVTFTFEGTATNGTDYTFVNSHTFGVGETTVDYTLSSFDDNLLEGNETILIIASIDICGQQMGDTLELTIIDEPFADAGPDITSCTTDSTVYGLDPSPAEGTWSSPNGINFTDINAWSTNVSVNAPGTYTGVWTTNIVGLPNCNISDTMEWTVLPPYYFDLTVPEVNCFGDDLTITVNNDPGNSAFDWTFTNAYAGNGSGTSVNVPYTNDGTVDVAISANISGCTFDTTFSVQIPPELVISNTVTNVTCFGVCDGSIDVDLSGGTPGYTFSWDNGETTEDLTGLCPGDYTLTATDNNGCEITTTGTITEPNELTLALIPTDMSDVGVCDGTIDATVGEGTAPYTYSWDNGETTEDISGLCEGTYCLTVTDANGCEIQDCADIQEPTAVDITLTATDVTCFGVCDGTVSLIIVNPGDNNLTFDWQISSGTVAGDNLSAMDLCAQTVTVTVTDGSGASDTESIVVGSPSQIQITETHVDASCNASCDGSIDLNVSEGTPGYTYSWDNGEITEDIVGLCAGNYCVQVTDNNGCIDSICVEIVEPLVISLTLNSTPSTCGQDDGGVSVSATGGTVVADYQYEWQDANGNGIGNTASMNGLFSGNYCVTVTDDNGCSITECIQVNDLAAGDVSTNVLSDVICFGDCNGSAEVNITNGNSPYIVDWLDSLGNTVFNETNVTTTSSFNMLCQGEYTVSITDNIGCVLSETIVIYSPTELEGDIDAITNISCFGLCDGTIDVSVFGGTSPYSYAWDSGESIEDLTGLCAGNYVLTITDANSCSVSLDTTITEPSALVLNIAGFDVSCFEGDDGQVIVIPSGGTVNNVYQYNWTNDALDYISDAASVNGLEADVYIVTVLDDNNCSASETIEIFEPSEIELALDSFPSNCGQENGGACVYASEGTPGYNFTWWNASGDLVGVDSCISNVLAGFYTIKIEDNNGCSKDTTINVPDIPGPIARVDSVHNVSCFGYCDGEIFVGVSGGNSNNFSYFIASNNGNYSPTVNPMTGLCAGSYDIQVIDDEGCIANTSTLIYEPDEVVVSASGDSTICIGGCATVSATAVGGDGQYTYLWDNQFIGAFYQVCPDQNGVYEVVATDGNGCISAPDQAIVNLNPPLIIDLSMIGPSAVCPGESLTVDASYSGGSGLGYQITWSPDPDNGLNPQDPPVTYTPNSDMYVYAMVQDNCETPPAFDSIPLIIFEIPEMEIMADPYEGCAPLTVNFWDLISPTPIGYEWDFGDGMNSVSNEATPTYTYNNDGTYDVSLIMTTPDGCVDSLTVSDMISVYENPVAIFTVGPQPTTIFQPEITFDATESYLANSYDWDYGDGNNGMGMVSIHEYGMDGTYTTTLTVTTEHGCVDTASVNVIIDPEFAIYIPNAFTPDGDGTNDTFKPEGFGLDPDNYEFFIYDRWGNLIFRTTDVNEGWDGVVQECFTCGPENQRSTSQIDVYVWLIKTVNPVDNNRKVKMNGHVTLIK